MKRGRSARRTTRKGRRRAQRGGSNAPASGPAQPLFQDAYAITMQEEFPDRFRKIKEQATAAGLDLKPWNGVKITAEDLPNLPSQGIGTTQYSDRAGNHYNFGAIGCFLAHRKLLEHLVSAPLPAAQATIIFEDDANIPPDFKAKLAAIEPEIPADWDILYLGKSGIEGKRISPNIMKLERDMTNTKNYGTWAYMVKNSSIKDRLLPIFEHMNDFLDNHTNKFADKVNMYLVDPPFMTINIELNNVSAVSAFDKQLKASRPT